jgi:hypothetical protein
MKDACIRHFPPLFYLEEGSENLRGRILPDWWRKQGGRCRVEDEAWRMHGGRCRVEDEAWRMHDGRCRDGR